MARTRSRGGVAPSLCSCLGPTAQPGTPRNSPQVSPHSRTRNDRWSTRPESSAIATRAVTITRLRPGYLKRTRPCVPGRSSRDSARSLAIRRPPANRETVASERPIASVTFPRFATRASSARERPLPATRRAPRRRRRTTAPGARTTTTTPMRIRTATPSCARRLVVKRTSASWSPGSARTGSVEDTLTRAVPPGAIATRRGLNASHPAAERRPPEPPTTLGRPRRSSAKPARETSTTTRLEPAFLTSTVARPVPSRARRAGDTVTATGGRVVPAPAAADAGTSTSTAAVTRARATIIAR
jgi:hypothetical protein